MYWTPPSAHLFSSHGCQWPALHRYNQTASPTVRREGCCYFSTLLDAGPCRSPPTPGVHPGIPGKSVPRTCPDPSGWEPAGQGSLSPILGHTSLRQVLDSSSAQSPRFQNKLRALKPCSGPPFWGRVRARTVSRVAPYIVHTIVFLVVSMPWVCR